MSLRIAIVATAHSAIGAPFIGGLEMHTHLLAEGLTARGHDVTVFAADGAGDFRLERMRPIDQPPGPVGRHDLCAHPVSALSESDSYLDTMLRLGSSRFDLVHLNTAHYVPFACTAMVPAVVTGTLHTPAYPWLQSALQRAARGINPVSIANVSVTNAASWDLRGVTHRTILNGVDLARWRMGGGGHGAVWTGRIVPEKAPHLAIDAARIAGMPLRVFGPTHDDDYFDEHIAPRLGEGIEYVGHWPVDHLAQAVGSAAVAIVTPNWDEPFGLIVAEALACGTPLAAFDRGAMSELIGTSDGRLARPNDTADLARAMLSAATLDRSACRRSAERRFSAERMIDDYESWFEFEVARRSGRRLLRLIPHLVEHDDGRGRGDDDDDDRDDVGAAGCGS